MTEEKFRRHVIDDLYAVADKYGADILSAKLLSSDHSEMYCDCDLSKEYVLLFKFTLCNKPWDAMLPLSKDLKANQIRKRFTDFGAEMLAKILVDYWKSQKTLELKGDEDQ